MGSLRHKAIIDMSLRRPETEVLALREKLTKAYKQIEKLSQRLAASERENRTLRSGSKTGNECDRILPEKKKSTSVNVDDVEDLHARLQPFEHTLRTALSAEEGISIKKLVSQVKKAHPEFDCPWTGGQRRGACSCWHHSR
jgi:hypothetical protein